MYIPFLLHKKNWSSCIIAIYSYNVLLLKCWQNNNLCDIINNYKKLLDCDEYDDKLKVANRE